MIKKGLRAGDRLARDRGARSCDRRGRQVATAASGLKTGQTVYFIPKDTLNPYEVIADKGGAISLKEIGDKQVVSSGTQDTGAAQLAVDPDCHPVGRERDRDRRQRPGGALPAAQPGEGQGIAIVSFDSDVNCRQLFINQANTEQIGRSEVSCSGSS